MGISNMVKNAAGRYLGRSGTGTTPTTGRTRAGGMNTRRTTGTPASSSGGVGRMLRGLLNRR
ncbi:hypothetical protein [Arthrobacter sedimenti]|uniref:hypothetical protein n=1 Tax=Arthrobacter sedimenti TaxID=2694931 RepID=UPI000B355D19|nr:hypothetical protein [Arthrobacter sedimenti]OUM43313.1 hypothetical protein B8W73_05185 [Arthrobacter agilis]